MAYFIFFTMLWHVRKTVFFIASKPKHSSEIDLQNNPRTTIKTMTTDIK